MSVHLRLIILTSLLIASLAGLAQGAAAQDWGPPAVISGAAMHAPAQATGEEGTVAVAGLVSDAEGARKVRVAVRDAGGEAHSFAVGLRAGVATFPDVAVDNLGVATAVWTQGRAIATVRCSVRGCGPTRTIGRTALPVGDPQVAIGPAQRATVLWRGVTSRGTRRLQWRIGARGRFGPTHTLGEFGYDLQLAVDNNGRSTAVWTAATQDAGLRIADRVRGEFERPRTLSPAGQPATRARLVVIGGGEAILAWRAARANSEGVHNAGAVLASIRPPRGEFGPPTTVSSAAAQASAVEVALAPHGEAVLAWLDYGPGVDPNTTTAQTVHAAHRAPGGVFGAPQQLGGPADIVPEAVRQPLDAALDPPAVVWAERGGTSGGRVMAAVGQPDGSFAPAEQLASGAGQALEPRISPVPAGVLATWTAGSARIASDYCC
jgi:hypothetical protein